MKNQKIKQYLKKNLVSLLGCFLLCVVTPLVMMPDKLDVLTLLTIGTVFLLHFLCRSIVTVLGFLQLVLVKEDNENMLCNNIYYYSALSHCVLFCLCGLGFFIWGTFHYSEIDVLLNSILKYFYEQMNSKFCYLYEW
jgi:hypothetical protein